MEIKIKFTVKTRAHTHAQHTYANIHSSKNTTGIMDRFRGDNYVSFAPLIYEQLTFHTYESDLAVYVQEAPSFAIRM